MKSPWIIKHKQKITIVALSLALCVVGYYVSYNAIQLRNRRSAWKTLSEACEKKAAIFNGEACIVIKDLNTRWKIAINENTTLPSASVVKIPIMTSCFYASEKGKIDLEEVVTLSGEDKVGGSGVLKNTPAGTKITVRQLIKLMITKSDNTAANMLIALVGFDYLNKCFKRFGLKDTNISRKIMDIKSREEGIENYTTAHDMALLLEKIYREKLINKEVSAKCLKLLKQQKINDRIPRKLPGELVIAHKTGLEKGVCHDAGIVFTDRGDFLICVLIEHPYKTAWKAKKFISQIAFLTYNYYRGERG